MMLSCDSRLARPGVTVLMRACEGRPAITSNLPRVTCLTCLTCWQVTCLTCLLYNGQSEQSLAMPPTATPARGIR